MNALVPYDAGDLEISGNPERWKRNVSIQHAYYSYLLKHELSSLPFLPMVGYYGNTFVELGKISKGGFGTVFKAQDLIDRNLYAIKKVRINGAFDASRLSKVLREVQILSKLDHPHVLRYYSAWFEVELPEGNLKISDIDLEGQLPVIQKRILPPVCKAMEQLNDTEDTPNLLNNLSQNSENKGAVDWGFDSSSEPCSENGQQDNNSQQDKNSQQDNIQNLWGNENSDVSELSGNEPLKSQSQSQSCGETTKNNEFGLSPFNNSKQTSNSNSSQSKSKPRSKKVSKPIIYYLYIKTQLCSNQTLSYWLNFGRNKIEPEENYRIFSAICSGLQYIHDKGLIHRDIKPDNIFFNEEGIVKIGDFGLSRVVDPTQPNPIFSEQITCSISDSDRTSGIGTATYAAPEQMHATNYTSSVDIYSLGIILFEMHYLFFSKHERATLISQLRNRRTLPEGFADSYPEVSCLILSMTHTNPSARPTAKILCDLYNDWKTQKVFLHPKHTGKIFPCGQETEAGSQPPTDGSTDEGVFKNGIVEDENTDSVDHMDLKELQKLVKSLKATIQKQEKVIHHLENQNKILKNQLIGDRERDIS